MQTRPIAVHALGDAPAQAGPLHRLSRALQDRPARFATGNLMEAQRHLRTQDRSIDLRVPDVHAFRGYRELQLAPLGSIGVSLGCIESGSGYELAFQSRDEMLVNIPLRGHGWVTSGAQTFPMGSGQVLLVGPSCHVVKHWAGSGQVLSLHIPLTALDAAMGRPEPKAHAQALPLYLPPVTLIDHGRLQTLLGFIELLVLGFDAAQAATLETVPPEPAASPPSLVGAAAQHAEHLLLALLIDGLQLTVPAHDGASTRRSMQTAMSAAAPAASLPPYMRRVEAYIRAHASVDIGIDDLASAAGVSRRTLQYGFQKVHGVTPMLFLKRVRFEQARSALLEAAAQGRKVGDIAADIGCFNVSQFSRDYRAMFGESPSETVAAPRQLGLIGLRRV